MQTIPIFQVDAFTSEQFKGNPAAVCPLKEWLPDETLLAIANENNLSETAFFVPKDDGFHLRWFTPASEVDLCGHATLASAWVLFNKLEFDGDSITFSSQSGPLTVTKKGEKLTLNFPLREGVREASPDPLLFEALGVTSTEVYQARDTIVVLDSEAAVKAVRPDLEKLKKLKTFGVVVTAPGEISDFVSRAFFADISVPEDPVTGSTHCTLAPYWAKRLGKNKLSARQVSARGGDLECEIVGDRVEIAGNAVLFLEGVIYL